MQISAPKISDVQDLISAGRRRRLVLSPHSNTAFASVLKDAKDNNIPIATYNNNITEGADLLVAQVTPPFKEWQRQTTEWLAKAMGGKGNVIVLRGITGTPVDGYEWDGAKEVLDQNPGIKVILQRVRQLGLWRGEDCSPELPCQPSRGQRRALPRRLYDLGGWRGDGRPRL